MTLPASGAISLSQVNTELGNSSTASINMNSSAVRTLFGKASGAISMSDGYGKANQFSFTISSNQTNANLRTLAVNAGWNQSSKVVATISGGVYISSNGTGTPALTVSGSFPGGVELINNGLIIGMGGNGGNGGGYNVGGSNGSAGGLALSVSSAISINNAGTIGGGGGGGGGGAGRYSQEKGGQVHVGGGGGGGGRSSNAANSSGGSGGGGFSAPAGSSGGAGTVSAAGGGGAGGSGSGITGGTGGSGGGWGSTGGNGTSGSGASLSNGPYNGGGGGGAVSGNSNVTWIATGTRLGGIS